MGEKLSDEWGDSEIQPFSDLHLLKANDFRLLVTEVISVFFKSVLYL